MSGALAAELRARQNPDGGWGATQGAASNSECTALAHLALATATASSGDEDAAEGAPDTDGGRSARWLLTRQQPSGAWSYWDGGPVAPWPTAIALLALLERADANRARERGFGWLLAQRGRAVPWLIRLRAFVSGRRVSELDSTLEGWPWIPGTLAWIEPTAWALMALKATWGDDPPRAVRRRIREGEAMILDRACPGGGWNYGNSRSLGQDLDPYPDTTALALLGLRGATTPEVERGFSALARLLESPASGLALALAVLSLRAWGRDASALQARLVARYDTGGFLGENRALALAVLALAPTIDWLEAGAHA